MSETKIQVTKVLDQSLSDLRDDWLPIVSINVMVDDVRLRFSKLCLSTYTFGIGSNGSQRVVKYSSDNHYDINGLNSYKLQGDGDIKENILNFFNNEFKNSSKSIYLELVANN